MSCVAVGWGAQRVSWVVHDGRGGDDDGGGVYGCSRRRGSVLKASVGWQRRLDGWGGARVEWRWLRVVVEAGGRPETRRNLRILGLGRRRRGYGKNFHGDGGKEYLCVIGVRVS
ncbi:hypothetical protein Tco_0605922 [Tanacetum coccineum]